MKNKILQSISMCRRAGKLVMGFDPVCESIQKKEVKIILIAQDLSPKSKKEILLFAERGKVKVVDTPYIMDEFWQAIGKRAGILAITDKGLSDKISAMLIELDQANPEPTQFKGDII